MFGVVFAARGYHLIALTRARTEDPVVAHEVEAGRRDERREALDEREAALDARVPGRLSLGSARIDDQESEAVHERLGVVARDQERRAPRAAASILASSSARSAARAKRYRRHASTVR